MIPKQTELEIPLLRAMKALGGKARPEQVYALVTKYFPDLTESDLTEELESGGGNKWKNRIRWVRQKLISKGDLESPEYGWWMITSKGTARVEAIEKHPSRADRPDRGMGQTQYASANLEELADEYLAAFKQKVRQNLQELTPQQFERFAGALLSAYGFVDVLVTGKTRDGGIDGHGKLKVGLATLNVAFQCKRWQGNVPTKEIHQFRGVVQGAFEQGYFFTTSDFVAGAQEASVKKGAATIVLLNGDAIVQLMIEKGLGIRRRAVEIYEDQIENFFDGIENTYVQNLRKNR
jgi:restriction system protein